MTLNGIPLHPLVVHAAVVFTPLALAGIVWALAAVAAECALAGHGPRRDGGGLGGGREIHRG
ncbi:MAG: hypothetical protein M3Z50_04355 [Actinomycetota bacterium]|nr:hypothetical protein [Actinomycetota bacterium]